MQQSDIRASIVIVADTLFYPPRRNGFSVRYQPLVLELAKRGYLIDIIVLNKYGEDYTSTDIKELGKLCNRIDVISAETPQQSTIRRFIKKVSNFSRRLLPFGIPYHLIDNNTRYYQNSIQKLLAKRRPYDTGIGVGVGGINANILLTLEKETRPHKVICDFVDSAYLLYKRSNSQMKAAENPLVRLEMTKTKEWENTLCKRCECVYISDKDARTVDGTHAHIIPNCIVEDSFDKSRIISLDSPNIAFLGNMSYPPNIDACLYLITNILPAVRKKISDIHLYIIGRHPSEELLRHSNVPNIHFTGEVENIWDYIRSVDTFVFPMQSGAGLQNKVLEAMYAGKPVVTSPIGNEGIGAENGVDAYIANNLEEYIESIEDAISNGDKVGNCAKEYIQKHYSSHSLANSFETLLTVSHMQTVRFQSQ